MYDVVLSRAVERAAVWNMGQAAIPATFLDHIWHYVHVVYEYAVLSPLARLYLYGPSFGGWGFWNGLGLHVICSQKTNLLPEFWQSHPTECIQIVSKNFYGMIVLFETLCYFLILWVFAKSLFACITKFRKPKQPDSSFSNPSKIKKKQENVVDCPTE
jgi:hypothetical protein